MCQNAMNLVVSMTLFMEKNIPILPQLDQSNSARSGLDLNDCKSSLIFHLYCFLVFIGVHASVSASRFVYSGILKGSTQWVTMQGGMTG